MPPGPCPDAWLVWVKLNFPCGLRHCFQAHMWSVTSDMATKSRGVAVEHDLWQDRRSREMDVSYNQLQCLWRTWCMPEGSLLPSPFLLFKTCNLCMIKWTFFISLSSLVLGAEGQHLPHPPWPQGMLAGLNQDFHYFWVLDFWFSLE